MSKKNNSYLYWIIAVIPFIFAIVAIILYQPKVKKKLGRRDTRYDKYNVSLMNAHRDKVFGIDVSQYQGNIKWESIKLIHNEFPVGFIFIRATMGALKKDTKFNKNWKGALKQNKPFGAYHYFRPNENATKQAQNFIRTVKLRSGDLPPVLDIEEHPRNKSMAELKSELKIWLDLVEAHYKVKPIIYSSDKFFTHFLEKEFNGYPLWIANYNTWMKNPKEHWDIWQFSERGKVNGINGYVDLNIFHGNLSKLQTLTIK